MLKNIVLNFFDELIKVDIPKNLSDLRAKISQAFLFTPKDAEEIILTYNSDQKTIPIENEEDYKTFLNSKIEKIDLEISQNSKIYQENLNKIAEEVSEDKKKLELLIQRNNEIEQLKETKFIEEKKQIKDITEQINILINQKIQICNNIIEKYRNFEKEKIENEKQINELQKKLGMEITIFPKENFHKRHILKNIFKKEYHQYHHHLHNHKKSEKKLKKNKNINEKIENKPFYDNALKEINDWTKYMYEKTNNITKDLTEKFKSINPLKKLKQENKNENLEIHYNVKCDGCKMYPIKGNRYKCKNCKNFDFCENCYEKNKQNHKHEFVKLEKSVYGAPRFLPNNSQNEIYQKKIEKNKNKEIHYNITCDGCKMKPIIGNRYKCTDCTNFDFCENCYQKNKENHKHKFKKFEKSVFSGPRNCHQNLNENCLKNKQKKKVVHEGYICDGCEMNPIVGIRYKCGVCPDFDFCENCEKKLSEKHGHPFIKIYDPSMEPKFIEVKTDNEKNNFNWYLV